MTEAAEQVPSSSGVAQSVDTLLMPEEQVGTPACVSKGDHHVIREHRDHYFREFMKHLTDLWLHQQQTLDDEGGIGDENEDAKIQAAKDCLEKAKRESSRFQDEYNTYDAKTEDCFMYRDFWIPPKMPNTEKLNFKDARVRFDGEYRSFKEATVDYIDRIFGDRGVFRVPPFLVFTDRAKLRTNKTKGDLSLHSDEELHELGRLNILKQQQVSSFLGERKAGRAVEKLARILEQWAERENDNMFIFTGYEYNNYLKNVKSIQVMDKVMGDYDIIAISEMKGVFFFQSKGCKSEEDVQKKVKEAFVRTMRDRFYFFLCNRDLSHITSELPMYGFVALPNLSDGDLEKYTLCQSHKSVVLTSSSLENVERFADWINGAIRSMRSTTEPAPAAFTHEGFKELCGRYAGPASVQATHSTVAAIVNIGKKLQLNFLTPVQREVCDDDRKFMIISGDVGSGKSLILATKAKQILRKTRSTKGSCHVNIVTCSEINESLICPLQLTSDRSCQQMKKLVQDEEGITVSQFEELQQRSPGKDDGVPRFKFDVTPEEFVLFIIEMTREKDGAKQHLFMDEVPFDLLKRSREKLDEAMENIPAESYVWLSVSTHSYRVKSSENENPRWIREFMPRMFHFQYLNLIKRVPVSLVEVMKEMQKITGDGHGEFSKCGHVVRGPKPLLCRLDECLCPTTANVDFLVCSCTEERMFATFEKVFEKLRNIDKKDIAIMVHNFAFNGNTFENLRRLLSGTFQRLNINLNWSTVLYSSPEREGDQEETMITVYDAQTFSGSEAKVLVDLDQCGMFNHFPDQGVPGWYKIPMMRNVGQYILVTWPEKEAAENWCKYISEYEKDVADRDELTAEQITHQRELVVKSKAASHAPSCLEQLTAKNLFTIMSN